MESPLPSAGTPVLPPVVAKWASLIVLVALTVLGTLVGFFPEERSLQIALALATALAALLGIASPGIRKPMVALLCVASLSLSGCKEFVRPVAECTLDSAANSILESARKIDAYTMSGNDWRNRAQALALQIGASAFGCALKVAIELVEKKLVSATAAVKLYSCDPQIASCDGGGTTLGALLAQQARLSELSRLYPD